MRETGLLHSRLLLTCMQMLYVIGKVKRRARYCVLYVLYSEYKIQTVEYDFMRIVCTHKIQSICEHNARNHISNSDFQFYIFINLFYRDV